MELYDIAFAFGISIFTLLIARYLYFKDLNRAYRKLVHQHFTKIGLNKITVDRLAKSDQRTIDKFLRITEVVSIHENNSN